MFNTDSFSFLESRTFLIVSLHFLMVGFRLCSLSWDAAWVTHPQGDAAWVMHPQGVAAWVMYPQGVTPGSSRYPAAFHSWC